MSHKSSPSGQAHFRRPFLSSLLGIFFTISIRFLFCVTTAALALSSSFWSSFNSFLTTSIKSATLSLISACILFVVSMAPITFALSPEYSVLSRSSFGRPRKGPSVYFVGVVSSSPAILE
ncbi:hypothetical protein GGR51DRAFT_531309 [Nemania sp. FL0031]|nr:hypothetical protein GGR51DRAFT_531309 [Nemania sp. FL0031]